MSFEAAVRESLHRLGVPSLLDDYHVQVSSSSTNTTISVHGRVPVMGVGSLLNVALFEAAQQVCPDDTWASGVDRSRLEFCTTAEDAEPVPEHIKLSVPDAELREYFDEPAVLCAKVRMLAHYIRHHHHRRDGSGGGEFVVHTGAGVSTAAKIPDFRGPNGVWTRRDRNMPAPTSVPMEIAEPTYTHRALVAWQRDADNDGMDYLVSQNVDGLHRRSGIGGDRMSELHGNCFKEICADCGQEYLRTFDVKRRRGAHFAGVRDHRSLSGISHITGRKCDACRVGMLRDSIIHFRENLPEDHLARAMDHAKRASVSLCIGTSLHVTPAADIPVMSERADHRLSIINLQATGKDAEALASGGLLIHGKCDDVMRLLVQELGIRVAGGDGGDDEHNVIDYGDAEAVDDDDDDDDNDDDVATDEDEGGAIGGVTGGGGGERAAHAHFFEELGLPPTLVQLPPSLVLTQTHTTVNSGNSNTHEWSLSLGFPGYPLGKEDLVARVEYHLHPSFHRSVVEVDAVPFNLEARRGWGEFEVNVYVHFHPGMLDYPLKITHQLRFDRAVSTTQAKVPPMKVAPGFKDNLRERSVQLRPTRTRVRRYDGTTYIEPPIQQQGGGGGGGGVE